MILNRVVTIAEDAIDIDYRLSNGIDLGVAIRRRSYFEICIVIGITIDGIQHRHCIELEDRYINRENLERLITETIYKIFYRQED